MTHQFTIFEALTEAPNPEPVRKARLTQLPAPVLPPAPEPPPLPPITPFKEGQQVIVKDPAGDWVGKIYSDDGGQILFVLLPDRPTAVGYHRDQVKAMPKVETSAPIWQTWDESIREMRENPLPKVDCKQCQHFRPYNPLHRSWSLTEKAPINLYECGIRVFPGPASQKGIYGMHIGCRKFEEATNGEGA